MTAAAQRWFDGGSNHGVQVVQTASTTDTFRFFDSRDHSTSTDRPKLTVVYTRPDTPVLSSPTDGSRYDTAPPLRARYYDPGGTANGFLDFYLWGTTQSGQFLDRQGQVRASYSGEYLSWDPDSVGTVPAGDYRWFVRASDNRHYSPGGCGRTDGFSCPRSLRVNRLPAAAPLSPAASAHTTDRTPTLSARYTDPEGRPGGVDIRLFNSAGTQLDPKPQWFSGDGSSGRTVYLTTQSLAPGTYSWDLRAWDGRNHSGAFSQRRSFTIDDRAPYKPALLGPTDGVTTCDTTPALSTRYDDPDGDTGGVDLRLFNSAGTQLDPKPRWWSGTGSDYRSVTYTQPTALAPGTYSWDVRAWDGYLYSDPDFHAPRWSFVVATRPTAPQSGSLTPLGGGLRVGWAAPSSDGRAAITGYTVSLYAGDTPTGTPVATKGVASSARTADFTGLDNTATYSAAVTATNTCGAGSILDAGTSTPDVVPGRPTLNTARPGDQHVVLSWSVPSNSGSPISSYTVRAWAGGTASGTPTATQTASGSATSATLSGLTNGQQYAFTVSAINRRGEGAQSNALTATPRTVPSAPASFAVQPGDTKLTATWSPPSSDGGAPITGYNAYVHQGTTLVASDTSLSASARSRTFSGLTNGVTYTVTLQAKNAAGAGAEAVRTGTPLTTPGAPSNLDVIEGDHQLTATWEPPAVTGGVEVTGYNAYLYEGEALVASDTTMSASARSKTFTGLTVGIAYTIKVSSDNPAGESGTADGTGVPYGKPAAPALVSAIPGDRSVALDWDAPDDNGRPITRYTIRRYTGATASDDPVVVHDDDGDGDTAVTVTGLTNGQAYTFTVTATNVAGEGPASNERTTTPFGPPGAPGLTGAEPGDQQVALTWDASDPNGEAIDDHTVRVWEGDSTAGAPWQTLSTEDTSTSFTVTGLTTGQAYTFTVAAVNEAGEGSQSNSRTATPSGPPGPPADVRAQPGDASATATWTAADDNGAAIDGYRVEAYRASDDTSQANQTVSGDARTATIDGLDNGTAYYLTVTAHNAHGDGPTSARSDAVTPAGRPGAPSAVTARATDGSATVSWAPADDNGAPISRYEVEVYRAGQERPERVERTVDGTPASSAVVTALDNDVEYEFAVIAHNDVGDGPRSTRSNRVTPRVGDPFVELVVPGSAETVYGATTAIQGHTEYGAWVNVYPDADRDGQPDTSELHSTYGLDTSAGLFEIEVDLEMGVNRFVLQTEAAGRLSSLVAVPDIVRRVQAPPDEDQYYWEERVVGVRVRNDVDGEQAMQDMVVDGLFDEYYRAFPTLPGVRDDEGLTRWYRVVVPPGERSLYVDRLSQVPTVEFAELVPVYQPLQSEVPPNDPLRDEQYHLANTETLNAWRHGTGLRPDGEPVRIGVLERGFDEDHPDLGPNMDPVISNNECPQDEFPEDEFHGTLVAGAAGAATNNGVQVAGVGWQARIVPFRTGFLFTENGVRECRYGTRDIRDLVVMGNIDILNMSFGFAPYSAEWTELTNFVSNQGVVLVASAGNDGSDQAHYPSDFPNVIGVAATDQEDQRWVDSNFGPGVDLSAPGFEILTTAEGGGTREEVAHPSRHRSSREGRRWWPAAGTRAVCGSRTAFWTPTTTAETAMATATRTGTRSSSPASTRTSRWR